MFSIPQALARFWSNPAAAPVNPGAGSITFGDQSALAGIGTTALNFKNQAAIERPTAFSAIVEKARYYAKESCWLRSYLGLKRDVLHYGYRLQAAGEKGKEPGKGDQSKLDEWLASAAGVKFEPFTPQGSTEKVEVETNYTTAELVNAFILSAWNDFLLLDAAVSIWMEGSDLAILVPPEKCTYTDKFGLQTLRYQHGLSQAEIAALSPEEQKLFATSNPFIHNGVGAHFKVLKLAPLGDGLGLPSIFNAFRLFAEIESKEIGHHQMAFMRRLVVRHHKVGHEIKAGNKAGHLTLDHNAWGPVRDAKTRAAFENQAGLLEFISNWDHAIDYPWPSAEMFDAAAYSDSNLRLIQWGGPLAAMMDSDTDQPFLTPLLRAQATETRSRFGAFLSWVVKEGFGCPVPVQATWSDMIFHDARLATEITKFAQLSGWISKQTGREVSGFNHTQEDARKLAEADAPDAKKTSLPLWDSPHGLAPALGESASEMAAQAVAATPKAVATGEDPGATNGRPTGSKTTNP